MKLSIYSVQKTIFEGEVESIALLTPLGQITVLDNHLPLVSLVKEGEVIFTVSGTRKSLYLGGGVLEVRPQSEVVILAS